MPRLHDFQSYSVRDFSGGLDVRTSPQTLASDPRKRNRLTLARAVVYPQTGGVSKRFDTATYNTAVVGSATTAITGGFQFRHSNGTDYMVVGTDAGTIVRLNSDGTQANLATGLTTATRWYFDQFNDLALICNRADAPRSWDGTTFGTLAGSPPATGGPVVVHGNRALMLDSTNQRRLSWSILGSATDWTGSGSGNMTVSGPVGSPLVGLLRMTGEVLLGHRDYVTRLQGTSPTTYAITNAVPAQVSTGVISPQGMIFSNNEARWISQRGIQSLGTTRNFGDLVETFTSERIDPYFRRTTDYTVSLNQLTAAVSCYDSQNNRDLWAADTNGNGQNDTIFMRDVYTGAWSVWPSMSCASLWTAYNGTNGTEVFMGGYDGFVRRLNVDAATNAINARFNHISDLGDSQWAKSLRHLYVHVKEEGTGTLSVTTNIDYGASGGQTYSISLLGDSATLGSTFTLGTSTLGARAQIVRRLNVAGVGVYWEIGFANQQAGQNFTVYSYDALWRRRRAVGRATV